jgi:hypothetical protein
MVQIQSTPAARPVFAPLSRAPSKIPAVRENLAEGSFGILATFGKVTTEIIDNYRGWRRQWQEQILLCPTAATYVKWARRRII